MIRIASFFSGIGGLELGLERAMGAETVFQCEMNPYARRVLERHWPGVQRHDDITTLRAEDIPDADVWCGGFPCQDISLAGKGEGLSGARSGLWWDWYKLIRAARPSVVVLENVAALLNRGLGDVLGALADIGFDAEWSVLSAADVGAPHLRRRVFVIAYAPDAIGNVVRDEPWRRGRESGSGLPVARDDGAQEPLADATCDPNADRGRFQERAEQHGEEKQAAADGHPRRRHADRLRDEVADAAGEGRADLPGREEGQKQPGRGAVARSGWWDTEPDVGRVVARIPHGMDGGVVDADAPKGGTGEVLRAVRNGDGAPALQWSIGGSRGVQEAAVLLSRLRQSEGPPVALGDLSLARAEASRDIVRGVWRDPRSACTSCGRSAREQLEGEHPDIVSVVSRLLACGCQATRLADSGGPTAHRVDRLRCLGNAVVPQCAEVVGHRLLEMARSASVAASMGGE